MPPLFGVTASKPQTTPDATASATHLGCAPPSIISAYHRSSSHLFFPLSQKWPLEPNLCPDPVDLTHSGGGGGGGRGEVAPFPFSRQTRQHLPAPFHSTCSCIRTKCAAKSRDSRLEVRTLQPPAAPRPALLPPSNSPCLAHFIVLPLFHPFHSDKTLFSNNIIFTNVFAHDPLPANVS